MEKDQENSLHVDKISHEVRTESLIDYSDYISKPLSLSLKTIIKVLLTIASILIIFSLAGQIYRYYVNGGEQRYLTQLFNLDEEMNFPTYFSSFLLLNSAVLFLLIAVTKKKLKDRFSNNWYALSIIFLFMSMDETLMLHEQFSAPIRSGLHTAGFFYFAWLVPAAIFLILFLIFNIKFLLKLSYKYQILFIISGAIYLTGAFLMEMIGGKFLSFYGQNNLGYAIVTTIEETLEITGIILLIYILLSYIKNELPSLTLKLDD